MKKRFSLLALLLLSGGALFAEGEAKPRDQGAFWQTLMMIAIAILFFYFILWRPEQKRRKEMEKKRTSLKKGDTVTAMGMVGVIDKIKDKTVILRMVEGAKIEVLKAAITDIIPESAKEGDEIEKP